jgi:hypothetical protein
VIGELIQLHFHENSYHEQEFNAAHVLDSADQQDDGYPFRHSPQVFPGENAVKLELNHATEKRVSGHRELAERYAIYISRAMLPLGLNFKVRTEEPKLLINGHFYQTHR